MSAKTAKCERTGKVIPLFEGFFVADLKTGEWSFVGMTAPERGSEYSIKISRIIQSPEALVDWIAHLNEKSWFDAQKFNDFFIRFRQDNKLFSCM